MTKENNVNQQEDVQNQEEPNYNTEEKENSLSEIFEMRKFCVYCRASPKFCKCKEPMYGVWLDAIEGDVKEFIRKLKEFLSYSDKSYQNSMKYWVMRVDLVDDEIDKLVGSKLI